MQALEVLSSFVINFRAADPLAIASTSSVHELGSRRDHESDGSRRQSQAEEVGEACGRETRPLKPRSSPTALLSPAAAVSCVLLARISLLEAAALVLPARPRAFRAATLSNNGTCPATLFLGSLASVPLRQCIRARAKHRRAQWFDAERPFVEMLRKQTPELRRAVGEQHDR
jgi:hypothetical protein